MSASDFLNDQAAKLTLASDQAKLQTVSEHRHHATAGYQFLPLVSSVWRALVTGGERGRRIMLTTGLADRPTWVD